MPGLGGIELLRRLRGDFPNLPVILLTYQGSISDAVAAMRDGAFSYVTHPIDRTEIRALG
jgi:DNA-binding NtrC family response regulator